MQLPDELPHPAGPAAGAAAPEVPPPEVLPPHAPPRPEPVPAPEVPPAPASEPAQPPELPPPLTPPPEVPAPIVAQVAQPPAPGMGPPAGGGASVARSVVWGVLTGVLVSALLWPLLRHGGPSAPAAGPSAGALVPQGPSVVRAGPLPQAADFATQQPSADARRLADWVARSGDNGGGPFLIVDKRHARLYVFDGQARLSGASTVLVGTAVGDDTVPGVGDKPIAQVALAERTTPAGRFVAQRGRNATGEDVVWVDYAAAVSMHRVRTTNPAERRLQRLASNSLADKRITYGCINVPASFYDARVSPVFARQRALVYVLPEIKTLAQVFPGVAVRQPG